MEIERKYLLKQLPSNLEMCIRDRADDHEAGAADEISSAIAGFKCTLQMQA